MMGRRPKPNIREYFPFPSDTQTSYGFMGGGSPFGGFGGAGGPSRPSGSSGLGGPGGFGSFPVEGGNNWFASAGANLDQMIVTFGKVQKLMGMIRQMSPMLEMFDSLAAGPAVTAGRTASQPGAVRSYAKVFSSAPDESRMSRRTTRRAKSKKRRR